MNLIKPKRLKQGDTIAIIATSGPVKIEKINKAKKYFEKNGYKVKLGLNIEKEHLEYLAGTDNERLKDFHNAFEDKSVDAIICARGGYGAVRLISKIDYELIRNNPKIFCGYSDVTALSAILYKKCNLISFSAPMAQSDFGEDIIDKFTYQSFISALTQKTLQIKADKPKIYSSGNANGTLIGGNLATFVSLCGSDFIPDEKFIFFAEDLNEDAYKIDRYFSQLLNIKKFKNNLAAIVLGDFIGADKKQTEDLFSELAQCLNIPIVEGFPISHGVKKATVPYGAAAKLENETLLVENFTTI